MKEITNICNIVSNKLNNTNLSVKIEDESLFLRYLLTSGLVGIVADSDIEKYLTKENYNKLISYTMDYILKDEQQLSLIKEINSLLLKEDVVHVFLKGSHLKLIYPKSYYRGMGDIDILVKEEDLYKVDKIFKENNFKLDSRSIAHNVYKSSLNLDVEVHGGITDVTNKSYQDFLDNIFNYVKDNKLTHEYELVYLVYHLAKHLKAGGIGLRSVLDIAIYYKYYYNEIDDKLLNKLLNKTGLTVLFNSLLEINNELFNYDFKTEKLNKDDTMVLLDYIVASGVHGSSGINTMSSRVASKGKFKLLLNRLFPSYKEMKGFYPSLKYMFIFLPFYYIFRIFKLMLNPKRNIKKVKDIKDSDSKNLEELFKNLNI